MQAKKGLMAPTIAAFPTVAFDPLFKSLATGIETFSQGFWLFWIVCTLC